MLFKKDENKRCWLIKNTEFFNSREDLEPEAVKYRPFTGYVFM